METYPIIEGKNAVKIKGAEARKAAFGRVKAGAPKPGYAAFDVSLPAHVSKSLQIEGATTVVLPNEASKARFDVKSGMLSLAWDAEPSNGQSHNTGTRTGRCWKDYYVSGKWCKSPHRDWWVSNNTAWFKGYTQYSYWYKDGNRKWDWWAIKRKGTCRSKSVWTMAYCGVGSKKKGSRYQKILDVSPDQDRSGGNCYNVSLSVTVGPVGLGGSYDHCDKLDINFPNRTHFSDYWRGEAWRSERSVAYQYILRTKQGKGPRFTLWQPYCAGGVQCI